MPSLVKGRRAPAGQDHDATAALAEKLFRGAVKKGHTDPGSVIKSLSPQFAGALQMAIQSSPQAQAMGSFVSQLNEQLSAQLGKSITLTSPLSSGLVPVDLVAPTQLIYPVYSPFRNLVPRTPGQGTSHRAKVMTSISGALPGQLAIPGNRMSIPELPAGGGIAGNNWPNQLPASGSQSAVDVNVPYKFFGLTEAVSWLSQFAGQGFDDAAGLASLILLQEMMLLEERAMIGATSIALSTPAVPTFTARAAGSGETPVTGVTTNLYVSVTAVNYYGETAGSTITTTGWASGDVIDVAISPVPGALAYNIYVGTGASAPARTAMFLMAAGVGGAKFTLQGAIPTTGANPPAADTGTSSSTDYEGFISTISGHAATGGIYPAGFQGSYYNPSVGKVLSVDVVNAALEAMWSGPSGIFADPDDLWAEGTDLARFASTIVDSGQGTNYQLFVGQQDVGGVEAGVAVASIRNPMTQKVINTRVHPYLPQGTAQLMSWKLPQPWTNVGNVWENVMVQDYLSISWPVVDVTFRYSLFMYGALFSPAVQYNGLLQGLQKSSTTPYS